jgi:L-lactate dehydrogenase
MPKISIIGVGDVGATIAYTIQLSGLATEIVLVDANRDKAEGHALDMNHGLFFTSPVTIRAGEYADCGASDIVIVTAGARQRENETRTELTTRNGLIVKDIMGSLDGYLDDAKVLVIVNPVDVMTKVALESAGLPPGRVLGSGTVLDSARFRYELSRRCRVDPRNVHAYVIGEHGDSEVFLWSQVKIAGIELDSFCPQCGEGCGLAGRAAIEQAVRDSAYHLIHTKGYTSFGVSLSVGRIIGAMLRNESSVLTVSALMGGHYGITDVCLSSPCIVNAEGIARVIEAPLAADERERLHRSAEVVRSAENAMQNAGP